MTNGISLGKGKALRRSTSGLALEIRFGDHTRWVPSSQLHDDSEVFEPGHEGNVVVNEWWADKNGLSDSREQTRAR